MDKRLETAQLLARFKLQVKRSLNQTVDLELLARDTDYARQRLSEIEEDALDEDLLVMVLRLRDLLVPAPVPVVEVAAVPVIAAAPAPEAPTVRETRNYLMGARAW
ncbi:MAG TPA: hypothetical protein VFF03_04145 [Rhodocyclaceae bacterium]|nr:hypothetical protein [Rhodocyclaceae bacterium]